MLNSIETLLFNQVKKKFSFKAGNEPRGEWPSLLLTKEEVVAFHSVSTDCPPCNRPLLGTVDIGEQGKSPLLRELAIQWAESMIK